MSKSPELTIAEFNAILHLTSKLKVDGEFDIIHVNNKDKFHDYETNQNVDLKMGLSWLNDAIAYPLKHDVSDDEAELIADVLLDYEIIDEERHTYLLKEDDE